MVVLCTIAIETPVRSARGALRRRATPSHVLATPCELADRPLLDQAMVAAVIACIAIIGQGCCWRWRCGWRGRAAPSRVLATPRELAHRPLFDQAMIATVVACIAIERQGRRWWWWCRGWCCRRWRRRRARLAFSFATVCLLAQTPSRLPVGKAGIAIIGARSRRS